MKAITIYQPWASLAELREKKFETRSWATSYRGIILIHSAKTAPLHAKALAELDTQFLKSLGHEFCDNSWFKLPFGCIIAIAELVNVWHIVAHPGTNVDIAKHIPIGAESMTTDKHAPDFANYIVPTETEMLFGDWTPGRYAWQLENVYRLKEPIPAKGRQRIWNWDETEHEIAIDPWVIGPTKIWTPRGIMSGKQVDPGREDAVRGLEVEA